MNIYLFYVVSDELKLDFKKTPFQNSKSFQPLSQNENESLKWNNKID